MKMNAHITVSQIEVRKVETRDFDLLTDPNGPWGFAKIKRSYLEWFSQYRPEQNLMLVACFEGQIVGYFWNYAVPLKVKNEVVDAFGGTLFVHPDHRKKNYNVFNLLVRKALAGFENQKGIHYGFPVNKLVPYYQRVCDARYFGTLPRYLKILDATYIIEGILGSKKLARAIHFFCRPFLSIIFYAVKPKLPRDILIKEARFFDERFDQLWEKASSKFEIVVARNKEYLNWILNPESKLRPVVFAAERENELLGYIIVERVNQKHRNRGVIVDLFDIQDKTVARVLIDRAVKYFRQEGADKIEFHILNPHYQSILKSMGFRQIKSKKDKINPTHFLVRSYNSKVDDDCFYNRSSWFVTKLNTQFT